MPSYSKQNRRRIAVLALALMPLALLARARAEDADALERKIEAACLYNFAKFVEWPAEKFATADSPIVIGIVGDDPFGSVLDDTIKGRTAQDRAVVIKRFKTIDEAKNAHIIFVSAPASADLAKALDSLKSAHVLTVGDTSAHMESGGAFRFVVRDNKVSFDANTDIVTQAGLKVSSHLLRLAHIVNSGGK